MKKLKNYLMAILLIVSTSASAQKFYVSSSAGYGLGMVKNVASAYAFNFANYDDATKINKLVPIKYGQGFLPTINVGYQFSKNMAAELGAFYLMGAKTNVTSVNSATNKDNISLSAKGFFIEPTIKINTNNAKTNTYLKTGFIFGKPSITKELENKNGNDFSSYTQITNGGMAFGFKAAIGLEYKISSKVSLFGEATLRKIGYNPQKSVITKYTVNGSDMLGTLNVNDKEVVYTDVIKNNESIPMTQPKKKIGFDTDLGSASFNIGIKYSFK